MRRVGITLGEPCGIGPELVVRALSSSAGNDVSYILYGSPKVLERTADTLGGAPIRGDRIELRPAGPDPQDGIFPPEDFRQRAEAVVASLERACNDARDGEISAIVTAPIDKSVVRTLLPSFTGHTEYLAERAGVPRTLMLLDNGEIRVVLLTTHLALRDVPTSITSASIEETVRLAARSLSERFGIRDPRFALAALNPHAGETAANPEEESVFRPAVASLRNAGFRIDGPLSADSLFPAARKGSWDVVLSPYHDQGLVAVKYSGLDKVVNITLGLPYLRTSPGHGVAYDLAGTGRADPRGFERALRIASTERWDR